MRFPTTSSFRNEHTESFPVLSSLLEASASKTEPAVSCPRKDTRQLRDLPCESAMVPTCRRWKHCLYLEEETWGLGRGGQRFLLLRTSQCFGPQNPFSEQSSDPGSPCDGAGFDGEFHVILWEIPSPRTMLPVSTMRCQKSSKTR